MVGIYLWDPINFKILKYLWRDLSWGELQRTLEKEFIPMEHIDRSEGFDYRAWPDYYWHPYNDNRMCTFNSIDRHQNPEVKKGAKAFIMFFEK